MRVSGELTEVSSPRTTLSSSRADAGQDASRRGALRRGRKFVHLFCPATAFPPIGLLAISLPAGQLAFFLDTLPRAQQNRGPSIEPLL
jgi:hypothetical protein